MIVIAWAPFLVMALAAAIYLVCVQPTKAAFAELARCTFLAAVFFVLWSLVGHLWRLQ